MASGKSSKVVRQARKASRAAVAPSRSIPWGMIAGIVIVALFAGIVFGYAFVRQQQNADRAAALAPFTPSPQNQDPSLAIPGIVTAQFGGGLHVTPEQQVAYTYSPPIGGPHDFAWAACNGVVYDVPVRSENIVHSLEHGAVWIAYNPDLLSEDAIEKLADKVDGSPYTLMSPYPGLDQPISLQSWGHQLKLSDPDDIRIDQFIQALRRNPYTHPEVGASCQALGPTEFNQDNPPRFVPPPAPGTPGAIPEDWTGEGAAPLEMAQLPAGPEQAAAAPQIDTAAPGGAAPEQAPAGPEQPSAGAEQAPAAPENAPAGG